LRRRDLPSAPPALTRFSTTKGWPNFSESRCAAMRAIMSVLPPAASGTTMVTGRVGQSSAFAPAAPNST
jgi:hypothetical protein